MDHYLLGGGTMGIFERKSEIKWLGHKQMKENGQAKNKI